MQLRPHEDFSIVRGLEDHTDSTTYYVQAVIRNAKTDALIDTVNLADQGDGHRFLRVWRVPGDPSGLGFYISVTTSVYTDSGYTTKSTNHPDKYDTYLVDQRNAPLAPYQTAVDYKKIGKLVGEAVAKIRLPEPKPAPEPKIVVPRVEVPKVDLTPLEREIKAIGEGFSKAIEKLQTALDRKQVDNDQVRKVMEHGFQKVIGELTAVIDEFKTALEPLTDLADATEESLTGLQVIVGEAQKHTGTLKEHVAKATAEAKAVTDEASVPEYRRKVKPFYRV